jgi:MFS family permease
LLNNAANALTYGLMSVGCFLAGGVTNKISAKWTLFIGAAFYTPYAAGLYCNNRYGNEWFLLLGAGLCGVGASLLWASEAAIAVGYPEEEKRGRQVEIIKQLFLIELTIILDTLESGWVSGSWDRSLVVRYPSRSMSILHMSARSPTQHT